MKALVALLFAAFLVSSFAAPFPLSDGKTFKGWTGDTNKTWRIQDGAFVAGTLGKTVPRNEFLRTEQQFTNFILKVKFKLTDSEASKLYGENAWLVYAGKSRR